MIREFEYFHGAVFARLLHAAGRKLMIERFASPSNASYIVDGRIGLYIKYCAKRMSPWRFTFKKEHQDEIKGIKQKLGTVYVILVCKDDGLVCLSHAEFCTLLDEVHEPVEWVSATRRPRQMYAMKGSNGALEFKVGINEFPGKIFRST